MPPRTENTGPAAEGDAALIDPVVLGRIMIDVAERAAPVVRAFLDRHAGDMPALDLPSPDPMNFGPAYIRFVSRLWSDPAKLAGMQMAFWQEWSDLCGESAKKFLGQPARTLYRPDKADRRFKSAAWHESAFFDFVSQSYLFMSDWAERIVGSAPDMDAETRRKMDFYRRQFLDALSPSNFLLTNPDVLKETVESKGDNLIRGLRHMIEDLERGGGTLKISTTDYGAFEVGRNLAVTPGKVVWQNRLIQLIQYEPATKDVFRTPLLIAPPWINKYYILDLRPENSFVKWLVGQGHTVFMISWVNPDRELADVTFEDYLQEGLLAAIDAVRKATGEPACNVIGYCIGGTLLSIALAWLAEKGRADEVASATFLTTLTDFTEAGDLKLFTDETQLERLEKDMKEKGVLDGESLRQTFSILRANDMIWSFVVNNYLMGREPFPFDILYWNDDATNMPAAMHAYYLRNFYHDNLLVKPGGLVIDDVPIRLHKIETPSYFLSTREDHIAPWQSTYAATQIFSGPVTFTLSASGHVAGVVNPPDKNKYCHWTADRNPARPDAWLGRAIQSPGSWWPHWQAWIERYAGAKTGARKPGSGKMKALEDAPGRYVSMKARP